MMRVEDSHSDGQTELYGRNGHIFLEPNAAVKSQWHHPVGIGVLWTSNACPKHDLSAEGMATMIAAYAREQQLRRFAMSGGCIHGMAAHVAEVKDSLACKGVELVWRDWKRYASYINYPLVSQSNLIVRFVDPTFRVTYVSWEEMIKQEQLMPSLVERAERAVINLAKKQWARMRHQPRSFRGGTDYLREALGLVTYLQERGRL